MLSLLIFVQLHHALTTVTEMRVESMRIGAWTASPFCNPGALKPVSQVRMDAMIDAVAARLLLLVSVRSCCLVRTPSLRPPHAPAAADVGHVFLSRENGGRYVE